MISSCFRRGRAMGSVALSSGQCGQCHSSPAAGGDLALPGEEHSATRRPQSSREKDWLKGPSSNASSCISSPGEYWEAWATELDQSLRISRLAARRASRTSGSELGGQDALRHTRGALKLFPKYQSKAPASCFASEASWATSFSLLMEGGPQQRDMRFQRHTQEANEPQVPCRCSGHLRPQLLKSVRDAGETSNE